MSTKSLNETVTFKPVFPLPLTQRGLYMKHLYKSFMALFLRYKHSNNHRITEIQVYSSDTYTIAIKIRDFMPQIKIVSITL